MVNWGIAGCGWVARDFAGPAIAASCNGRVVALFDRDPAALDGFIAGAVATTDLQSFVRTPGLDAVYVATPNDSHRPIVEACARAGLAVLCEKPMATTLADARAMVAACRDAGVVYATAFDQRFHVAHQALARHVANGMVGTVTAIRVVYACWVGEAFSGDNWRIDPVRAGGGAMIDLAPHGLDLAQMLLGEPIIGIAAFGQARVQPYARDGGVRGVDDGAMLAGRSLSGALISLHVAYNCPETLPRRRLEIVGTRGQLVATDTMGQTAGGTVVFTDAADGKARALSIEGIERSPFLNQVEAFARTVRGAPFAFTPEQDLHTMELLMRAQSMIAAQAAEVV